MDVKELRTKVHMSQSQFATYFEIPIRTLQKWEQGVSAPAPYIVTMIERILRLEQRI